MKPARAEPAAEFEAWREQLRRGGLELAILLALSRGPRYGLEIIRHLEESTDLVVTEGTIYPILARLSRDQMLSAEWREEGAHPRKYYRLTGHGRRRLARDLPTCAHPVPARGACAGDRSDLNLVDGAGVGADLEILCGERAIQQIHAVE